jgi:hypothetical protein
MITVMRKARPTSRMLSLVRTLQSTMKVADLVASGQVEIPVQPHQRETGLTDLRSLVIILPVDVPQDVMAQGTPPDIMDALTMQVAKARRHPEVGTAKIGIAVGSH